ncbi:MAG TPA: helix-turn-helix domain-containing protein [Chloroflexota bacterium]|nr:helix-turn-helix domain-containing protein [Chloroflexota bacterium]
MPPTDRATTGVHWLDTRSLADYLNVTTRAVESWRQLGDGPPFVKVGRLCRYRRADVDAWIESRVRRSTSSTGPKSE